MHAQPEGMNLVTFVSHVIRVDVFKKRNLTSVSAAKFHGSNNNIVHFIMNLVGIGESLVGFLLSKDLVFFGEVQPHIRISFLLLKRI